MWSKVEDSAELRQMLFRNAWLQSQAEMFQENKIEEYFYQ